MRTGVLLAGVMAVSCLGGCAGSDHATQLKRLDSQVALLDRRVSQLERAGGGWAAFDDLPPAPADSAAPAARAARAGSETPSAIEIQQALRNAGFYQGAIDGKKGPQTRQAIREFQRVHGLKDDGVVGAKTWSELRAYADLATDDADGGAAAFLK